jgi:hypothetical protein
MLKGYLCTRSDRLPHVAGSVARQLELVCKLHVASCRATGDTKIIVGVNRPGVDVMITIFCDFRQFSAKKLAFFSKTNVMINFFKIWLCFETKTPFFSLNFSAKIF